MLYILHKTTLTFYFINNFQGDVSREFDEFQVNTHYEYFLHTRTCRGYGRRFRLEEKGVETWTTAMKKKKQKRITHDAGCKES